MFHVNVYAQKLCNVPFSRIFCTKKMYAEFCLNTFKKIFEKGITTDLWKNKSNRNAEKNK